LVTATFATELRSCCTDFGTVAFVVWVAFVVLEEENKPILIVD
jgi:hypothetical protein